MLDNGNTDEKVIALPFEEPTFNSYRAIQELPGPIFEEMKHLFTVFKQLEGKKTAVT